MPEFKLPDDLMTEITDAYQQLRSQIQEISYQWTIQNSEWKNSLEGKRTDEWLGRLDKIQEAIEENLTQRPDIEN